MGHSTRGDRAGDAKAYVVPDMTNEAAVTAALPRTRAGVALAIAGGELA
jgi:hypothetical protein